MMDETDSSASVIVRSIHEAAGDVPVILCGSRATGEATEHSDWDIFAVMPAYKIPLNIRRLTLAAKGLEEFLAGHVSVNPLPSFRLRWPGRSLLEWKLREEGRVLYAPAGFRLKQMGPVPLTDVRVTSYALSGLRYLIGNLSPSDLAKPDLSQTQVRNIRKGLLMTVQLRLLEGGSYAARFSDALIELGSDSPIAQEADRLAQQAHLPETWFSVRDLLLKDIRFRRSRRTRAFASNLQYVALSTLSGGPSQYWAITHRPDVSQSLGRAVVLLSSALLPGGSVDEVLLSAAGRALPPRLRPGDGQGWTKLRDATEAEWLRANPLVGL